MERLLATVAALILCGSAHCAPFAMPGGPEPTKVAETSTQLAADGATLELMLSFGTSKGGSAGHLALGLRDEASGEERVHSANFYADRDEKHERDFLASPLILSIPKMQYLYGTSSSLGPKASFGLDYGEVYKRTVVGIRVQGVPPQERAAIAAYLERMNRDFLARSRDTEYQRGEVVYGYTDLNCAKTIGSAFRFGAGYPALEIRAAPLLSVRKAKAALNANTPSEMAMQILRELDARGYAMHAVLYRKHPGSAYVDPHDEDAVAFGKLPNRFPSAISLDFRNDERAYEDYDNLYAMYLLRKLLRDTVSVDPATHVLRVESSPSLGYREAARIAALQAEADSKNFLRRVLFRPSGERIGDGAEATPASAR
ncbi:MAG TPA: hypothetical protein VFE23_06700 [Usitatibacter sp.]|jgi:hypothetical protein|nr:hypothetical protein [Usitatibacter sp.]